MCLHGTIFSTLDLVRAYHQVDILSCSEKFDYSEPLHLPGEFFRSSNEVVSSMHELNKLLKLDINTSEYEATGFSAAMANFGWDPTEAIHDSEAHNLSSEEFSSERFNRLTEIRNGLNLSLAKAPYNQIK